MRTRYTVRTVRGRPVRVPGTYRTRVPALAGSILTNETRIQSPVPADRITDPPLGLTHVAHHTPRRCALGNTACPRGTNEPQTPASFGDNSSTLKQPAAGITWHRQHAAGPPRSAVSPQNVGPRLPDDGFPYGGVRRQGSVFGDRGGGVIHRRA